jgi:tight adherence protein B
MEHFLIALGALAVVAVLEGLVHTLRFFTDRKKEELRRRLQSLGDVDPGEFSLLRDGKLSSLPFLNDMLRGLPALERLAELLDHAQVNISVAKLLGSCALLALTAGTLGTLTVGLVLGLPLALMAGAFPILLVLGARAKRSRKISEQLPDALDMMARSLRAGHALPSAFKLVASEMPSPISVEFGRAFEEQNLGMSFERTVVHMTRRAPGNGDLKIFAVSVIIQKDTGGNLVEILEKIAETIRSRYRFYGKLRSLTAEARVSAIVLGSLPFITAAALSMLNPKYISGLITMPMGRAFLMYAVFSWMFGLVWLRQMSKVDL